jgi:hypothetical protein
MGKKALAFLAGLQLSLGFAGVCYADNSGSGGLTRGGVLRCGGTNNLRLAGTEIQFTAWDFRNLSSASSVTVERVAVFDAYGNVLFDSRSSGLPPFLGGVYLGPATNIAPANNVLGPNQTTSLSSSDFVGFLLPAQRPIQVEFAWSAPVPVRPLDVRAIRLSRERDPVTGAQLADRARGDFSCVSIG